MSLFGQLRYPITVNDTAGSRVCTVWESCKSAPDLWAQKTQNCFKLFVNKGPNSALGRAHLTLHQSWAEQLVQVGHRGFGDDSCLRGADIPQLSRTWQWDLYKDKICPKAMGWVQAGAVRALCVVTSLWDTCPKIWWTKGKDNRAGENVQAD